MGAEVSGHGHRARRRARAPAACRAGDTLVVTKLDRVARSLPDARAIVEDLTRRQVKLSLGGSVHDPTDSVGRPLFNVLAMVAEFDGDLIRMRTREGMKVAKAKWTPTGASNPSSTSSGDDVLGPDRQSSLPQRPLRTGPVRLAPTRWDDADEVLVSAPTLRLPKRWAQ